MYGFEKSTNVDFLLRKELVQVCFGQYQTILNFEQEVSISIESVFELVDSDQKTFSATGGCRGMANALVSLLGESICRATATEDGALELLFRQGSVLRLIDGGQDAESYSIVAPGVNIIV